MSMPVEVPPYLAVPCRRARGLFVLRERSLAGGAQSL
jgi:hypothetical protein